MISNNPLKQYFRQPAIYVRLPSGGQHYPPGGINMPPNSELPVYPMTAMDEITYRTPDALFNGSAVVSVIQSCVPNITNAWAVPATDIDTLLVAIRIASYGQTMDVDTTCPACNTTNSYGVNLTGMLDQMKAADYAQPLRHGDLEINFRPMTYQNLNENNQSQFEQQRIMQGIPADGESNTEQLTAIGDALKKITEITVKTLSQSIASVRTPDALVTETEYIEDMLKNCDRNLFNQIRDHVIGLKSQAELRPLKMRCPDCTNEYEQPITLDMTNFFGDAS
jgi:hypothetical protein